MIYFLMIPFLEMWVLGLANSKLWPIKLDRSMTLSMSFRAVCFPFPHVSIFSPSIGKATSNRSRPLWSSSPVFQTRVYKQRFSHTKTTIIPVDPFLLHWLFSREFIRPNHFHVYWHWRKLVQTKLSCKNMWLIRVKL